MAGARDVGSGFQHDIHQRYAFLRALILALPSHARAGGLTFLDIGSGPLPLTRTFLGHGSQIVRADVEAFDDPEVVLLTPGEALPFADQSFDFVVALDVLEHVPAAAREALVRDCHRVARLGTIFSHPADRPEVAAIEDEFAALALAIVGVPIPFLEEHTRNGLPDGHEVASWAPADRTTLVCDNAPLAPWLVYNLIDYLYAFEFQDGAEKRAFNQAVNAITPFIQSGAIHYRQYICSFSDQGDAAGARAVVAASTATGAEAMEIARAVAPALVQLYGALRDRLIRTSPAGPGDDISTAPGPRPSVKAIVAQKDAQTSDLISQRSFLQGAMSVKDERVATLESERVGLQMAIAQKDQYISGLEAQATGFAGLVDTKTREAAQLTEEIETLRTELERDRSALAERTRVLEQRTQALIALEKDQAELQQELSRTRRAVAGSEASAQSANEELVAMRAQTTTTRAELQALRASASWRLTAPVRSAAERARDARRTLKDALPARIRRRVDVLTREQQAREAIDATHAFDRDFYLREYPDVAASKVDPLTHYLRRGAAEGRRPNALFDAAYYLTQRPDLAAAGVNPLLHYVTEGTRDGLDPHPLFDTSFYLQDNPDVSASGMNPLAHYIRYGGHEGRDPHPDFSSSWYLQQNGDVRAAGMNPLVHYLSSGWHEGRDPSDKFDSSFYLESHADVRGSGANPLVHYVRFGRAEGREARMRREARRHGYTPAPGLLPWFNPLSVTTAARLAAHPSLNVLLPRVGTASLSGGPNTALVLGCKLARAGVQVRFVSTDLPLDHDLGPLLQHLRRLVNGELPPLEFVDAHARGDATEFGERDVFLATAWWTAQQAVYAARLTRHRRFVYLIQDFEPLLHAASTQYALALETYALDHLPIINSTLLRDYLVEQRIGRFADPGFARRALVFEPALDRRLFHPRADGAVAGRRRLLFYARPQHGLRNLFELGTAALQKVIHDGVLDAAEWEFLGMGEHFAPIALGEGALLRPAPWLDLPGYARQMRESDILLSLMLSPHPSYPPLEMAASGGLTVTTAFANKTAERLAQVSPNIIAVAPTIEGIAQGLAAAAGRVDHWSDRLAGAAIDLPSTWDESLQAVLPQLVDELALLQGAPERMDVGSTSAAGLARSRVALGFGHWPQGPYDIHRRAAHARRRSQFPAREDRGLLSFLTPVWNTDPQQLEELVQAMFEQDLQSNYEWVVLDNGSDRPDTRAILARIAAHPCVRLHRSEQNLGIIRGTRFCLEQASGRYAATVDHDDLVTPDCVRVLSQALNVAGYPPLVYSDEDKLLGHTYRDPYLKPAWDPVLFANSCYIAHLIAFDRCRALELDAYTDVEAEGSHDWDTFVRFIRAGHTPLHIPEVLYTWRIHPLSTAGNVHAKPYVFGSQQRVLEQFIAIAAAPARFTLEPSLFFAGTPDWWIRRSKLDARPLTTIVIAAPTGAIPAVAINPAIPHETVTLSEQDGLSGLADIAERCAAEGRLVHVVRGQTAIEGDEWPWEAMGLFELFADTAIVGGRLHRDGRVVGSGGFFGFGRGCDAPDRGRALTDPGYFAQMWKQHTVSAVPFDHCLIDPAFLVSALKPLAGGGISLAHLGTWLGAACRRAGRRVVYSPILTAATTLDLASLVTEVEHEAFYRANHDLIAHPELRSPHLGTRPVDAFEPTVAEQGDRSWPSPALTDAEDLAVDRIVRRVRHAGQAPTISFSMLTSVYERTPAEYFRLAAASALGQRGARFEWIVLENGPVPDDVRSMLDEIRDDPRVIVLSRDVNVGIQGAMQLCLDRAGADYVVSLDADDVLEPDALEVLASAITTTGAELVFSDEDHLTGERIHTRFVRPGFDPVLNLENSYIWHACAFQRARGIELGVYTDPAAEFCHDWDTVCRFASANARIAHTPYVLYHWRSHTASQSHTIEQNAGSVASTRAVAGRVLDKVGDRSRYELTEFPLFRGAVEWWIRRKPIADPAMHAVLIGASAAAAVAASWPGVFLARSVVALNRRVATLEDWRAFGEALPIEAELVTVLDVLCVPAGQDWFWEAVKWFELQPDAVIVGGRVINERQTVVDAGWGRTRRGVAPIFRGLARAEPGAFALALKPQTIEAPSQGLFVARASFLREAVAHVLRQGVTAPFTETLGRIARDRGLRVVYSPLIEARPGGLERAWPADALGAGTPDFGEVGQVAQAPAAASEEPAAASQRQPSARLLAPSDWSQVGTRPEFYVRAAAADGRFVIHVYGREDFLDRGAERAAIVGQASLVPAEVDGILAGRLERPVPEGDYIVVLRDLSNNEVVVVSGVCCREAKARWPARFAAMLEEQARFSNPKPAERATRPPGPAFSITTAIYDVDPSFVRELAASVLAQRFTDFEWVLLDNGSRREDTQQVCREMASADRRIRFHRVDDNRHIIGGNRYLLEHAAGEYVIPVDGDDVLYPDALRILHAFADMHHRPDVLFTDEQKISLLGIPSELLWRGAWSPIAALSTCPASHLMALRRDRALAAGLYSADYARGSHDWDSALRLATLSQHFVHVPFVLYGWRMHPGSAAMNEDSKSYLAESQKGVVREALKRLGIGDRFDVELAHDVLGYYHATRRASNGPQVMVHAVIGRQSAREDLTQLRLTLAQTRYEPATVRIYLSSESGAGLASEAAEAVLAGARTEVLTYASDAQLVERLNAPATIARAGVHVYLNPALAVSNPDWLWEAVGTFDLDPQTGLAGGCILDPGSRVRHLGYVSGLDGVFGTPAYDRDVRYVYGAMGLIRRHVTAVYGSFLAVTRETLQKAGGLRGVDREDGLHGIELCLRAARHGIRTAYSPRMKATFSGALAQPVGLDRSLMTQLVAEYPSAGAPDPYYSRHCIPRADAFGSPIVD